MQTKSNSEIVRPHIVIPQLLSIQQNDWSSRFDEVAYTPPVSRGVKFKIFLFKH